MGVKKANTFQLNWSATLNSPYSPNIPLSGVTSGVMASTNTIYSNVMMVENIDNMGLEVTWTGTPTGTISVLCSNSGASFYSLTFSPVLGQPAGSAGGYLIDLNQLPFKYVAIQYTNASGSGTLKVYSETKDLN